MSNDNSRPVIVLVVATSIVTAIAGGVFGVWAKYDVLPSSLDNSFLRATCVVQSSEIINGTELCSCYEEALSCSNVYPCIVIKVFVGSSTLRRTLVLYKDLTSYSFYSKCSYYPVGKLCSGNSADAKARALSFKRRKGEVGSNFTCYVNNLQNPERVVAEINDKDAAKFIIFVASILVFFLPLAFINCFFFYKWKVISYLGTPFKRHNRVGSMQMSMSTREGRRSTAFTTTTQVEQD